MGTGAERDSHSMLAANREPGKIPQWCGNLRDGRHRQDLADEADVH
jgi:hypothetical protein